MSQKSTKNGQVLEKIEQKKVTSSEEILEKETAEVFSKKDCFIREKDGKNNNKNLVTKQIGTSSAACGFHCIKIKDISVRAGKTILIEHINLHIHCGKLTVIIGKNGAGKSTLIKAMLGEIRHEGSIEFRDMKSNHLKNLKIGYVPQHLNIDKNTPTSVYDMFAGYISKVPVFLHKSKKVYQKVKERLKLFEAQGLIDKQVGELSGGELQRVLLSIACTPVPNLLLLDEPVSGIDRNGIELFYRNIEMLKKNYDLAMILVSHDLEFVEKYADYVILLDKEIICEGTPKKVLSSKEFQETFGSSRTAWIG